jgi:hypothetical protein
MRAWSALTRRALTPSEVALLRGLDCAFLKPRADDEDDERNNA